MTNYKDRLTPANITIINDVPTIKRPRGFAAMDPAKQRELARKGGSSVQPQNRAFSQSSELARVAGAKGGAASKGGGRPKKEND